MWHSIEIDSSFAPFPEAYRFRHDSQRICHLLLGKTQGSPPLFDQISKRKRLIS